MGAVSTLTDITALHDSQQKLEAQAEELQKRNRELATLTERLELERAQLEERVFERTADLTNTNFQLHQEIAHRELMEQELLKREERFRRAVESRLDAFAIMNPVRDDTGAIVDFRYEYVNDVACRSHGLAKEELVGRTTFELYGQSMDARMLQALASIIETGQPVAGEIAIPRRVPGRESGPAGGPAGRGDPVGRRHRYYLARCDRTSPCRRSLA